MGILLLQDQAARSDSEVSSIKLSTAEQWVRTQQFACCSVAYGRHTGPVLSQVSSKGQLGRVTSMQGC